MSRILSKYYLKQGDYPNIPLGTTTVAKAGCAVCCVAMYLLSRIGGTPTDSSREAVVKAVAESEFFNSSGSIYWPPQSHTITVNSKNYTIGYTKTSDLASEMLESYVGFVRFTYGSASHFVLVDGINTKEEDYLKKLLVVDPAYGNSTTLYDAMEQSYKDNELVDVTPSTSQLDSNLKCVFNNSNTSIE